MVEEWTTQQLDKRNKKYLKVQVDHAENAAACFDQYCKKAEYTVMPNNMIHIFGYLDQSDYVNSVLTEHGVRVFSMQQEGDNLEEYFLNLVGGVQNA